MKRERRPVVTPEDFIRAWQKAENVKDVCLKLKVSRGAVLERARSYRSLGISLKELVKPQFAVRGRRPLDVAKLNQIAKENEP